MIAGISSAALQRQAIMLLIKLSMERNQLTECMIMIERWFDQGLVVLTKQTIFRYACDSDRFLKTKCHLARNRKVITPRIYAIALSNAIKRRTHVWLVENASRQDISAFESLSLYISQKGLSNKSFPVARPVFSAWRQETRKRREVIGTLFIKQLGLIISSYDENWDECYFNENDSQYEDDGELTDVEDGGSNQ